MEFRPLTLDAVNEVRPFFRFAPWRINDYTVGGLFLWRDYYRIEYCIADGALFVRQHFGASGRACYNLPLAEDTDAAIDRLIREHTEEDGRIRFCVVPGPLVDTVLKHGEKIRVTGERDLFDYLYTAESMKTFAGRHLSGHRNHMKHFARDHGDVRLEDLTAENREDAERFFTEVYLAQDAGRGFEVEENRVTLEVLDNYETYGFQGGILYADGDVAGFSFGETVNDTLYVHIEKSRRHCDGCYQTLTNLFAQRYCTPDTAFVNREEDMGDPGLRYAKTAYHPVELVEKYTVEIAV